MDNFGDAQSIKKVPTHHNVPFSRKSSLLPSKKWRVDDAAMSDREKMAKIRGRSTIEEDFGRARVYNQSGNQELVQEAIDSW